MAKDAAKPPTKLETVNLKVFIHCEGCRRKVKKIIDGLDGVQSIAIDSESGKVSVTGTVDAKTLMQRLQKSGKHAEPWGNPTSSGGKQGSQQNQGKATNNNNNNNENKNKETKEKQGGSEKEGENDENINDNNKAEGESNGGGNNTGGGGKGKKKKGGGGGGDTMTGGMLEMSEASANNLGIASKSMAAVSVQTGYSLQSAEYATHMFSDENANNCHIM